MIKDNFKKSIEIGPNSQSSSSNGRILGIDGKPLSSIKKESDKNKNVLKRRRFIKEILDICKLLFIASTGALASNIVKEKIERKNSYRIMINRFWRSWRNGEWDEALRTSKELEDIVYKKPHEFIKWLNNSACTEVQKGDFDKAEKILSYLLGRRIQFKINQIQAFIIALNLSWARYYNPRRGLQLQLFENIIIESIKEFSQRKVEMPEWIQLWSRRPQPDNTIVIPPFAVLARIYANKGQFKKAFELFKKEIEHEKDYAIGARTLMSLLSPSIGEVKAIMNYWAKVNLDHVDTFRAVTYAAEREFLLWILDKRGPFSDGPDEYLFLGQASGRLSNYYAACSLANVRNYLNVKNDEARRVKNEYIRRILFAYEKVSNSNMEPIILLKSEL
jgi:tetratricopeptide (TPR) repeat protein